MSQENRESEDKPLQGENGRETASESLDLAARSEEQGRELEAAYQLLAAYEMAQSEFRGSFLFEGHPALEGLRHAWDLACRLGEQSLAEHIYERMEPYLTLEESERFSSQLEQPTLNGLEGFGASSDAVEEIAGLLSGDFMKAAGESLLPSLSKNALSADSQTVDASDGDEPLGPGSLRLSALVGFDDEKALLLERGIIPSQDEEHQRFIERLKLQHGIESVPARATTVFRAKVHEDADALMLAAAAELGMPVVRMRMDENAFGDAVLCVMMANGITAPNAIMSNGFSEPGVLVLEDVDVWAPADFPDDEYFPGMTLSHGARKALMLIRSAALDPRVTVFASVCSDLPVEDYLLQALGPCEFFDIPDPSPGERDAIWDDLMNEHTSLSVLDRYELVRLTANMPRSDIRSAAREAVERAFRESIEAHAYLPVSRENILDKIAAYQPLDSEEYREIEDTLVEALRDEIASLDSPEGKAVAEEPGER